MKQALFLAILLFPAAALAQPAPQKPDLVLIPRDMAQMAANWITQPDPTIAVKLYAALTACIQDNPNNGSVMRVGPDQCPSVTAEIAERDKQIADLTAKLAAATKAEPTPEKK